MISGAFIRIGIGDSPASLWYYYYINMKEQSWAIRKSQGYFYTEPSGDVSLDKCGAAMSFELFSSSIIGSVAGYNTYTHVASETYMPALAVGVSVSLFIFLWLFWRSRA